MRTLSKHELHSIYQENTLQMEILALRLERSGEVDEVVKILELIKQRKANEPDWENIKI